MSLLLQTLLDLKRKEKPKKFGNWETREVGRCGYQLVDLMEKGKYWWGDVRIPIQSHFTLSVAILNYYWNKEEPNA